MIDPDGLLQHARQLAREGRSTSTDIDFRRGTSAAYYAVFHDLTERAANHLIGSAPDSARSAVRRTWKHGDLRWLASELIDRSKQLAAVTPAPALPRNLETYGPLADIAAADGNLVDALRRFAELQELRHRADYDHEARIDKGTLLQACEDADHVRARLNDAAAAATEALFTMLVVKQNDLKPRS